MIQSCYFGKILRKLIDIKNQSHYILAASMITLNKSWIAEHWGIVQR